MTMTSAVGQGGADAVGTDHEVVSTPEGDNEYPPDAPIGPVAGLQVPTGNAPLPYSSDVPKTEGTEARAGATKGGEHDAGSEHTADGEALDTTVRKTVDKLSLGQILT
ncbi:MAG: hypothetical protein M3O02_05915 [Acidobacteriota bacterium]|nr:hypothetical protein [Acidobacteriota bacterium]